MGVNTPPALRTLELPQDLRILITGDRVGVKVEVVNQVCWQRAVVSEWRVKDVEFEVLVASYVVLVHPG